MSFAAAQFLNGLSTASALFLLACGLSIIFGVTRVVNFAHGSLYMLGAYVAYSLERRFGVGLIGYCGAVLGAGLAVGAVGAAIELLVLRRIYRAPELFPLLATFGVLLVTEDAVLAIWGPDDLLGPMPAALSGAVPIAGSAFPLYDLVLIAVGPLVLAALWLVLHRTRWGTLVRAATEDRAMVGALGVRQTALFTSVFALGAFLAALGGALQLPLQPATIGMDLRALGDAFVVVVVGGLGSISGAFLAAILIGELQAFGIVLLPQATLVLTFLIMAVVLIVRPWGLLGSPEAAQGGAGAGAETGAFAPAGRRAAWIWAAVIALLVVVPAGAGDYPLVIFTEIVVLALFAASLHFIMGPGGMVSFGHAAYFGLGAYAVALLMLRLGWPMAAAFLAAPAVAGLGALIVGWFVVRLSGVYFAMLTLAFAQIVWSGAFQWDWLTGGDNGILGVWPAAWAGNKRIFYYLALLVCGAGVLALRRILFAPFGYTLRAARDSPQRCDAIGIDVRRHQLLAFTLAGGFAGLAGGVYALLKGSVFPTLMTISTSTDGLLMVLLGGIQTLAGPLVGAAVFTGLQEFVGASTHYWRAIMGLIILVLVLAFPHGIVGFAEAVLRRRTTAEQPA